MDPKPRIDRDGVPWCSRECPALGETSQGGADCAILQRPTAPALWTCLPAVRALAASEKRHREAWEWLEKRPWLSPYANQEEPPAQWGVLSFCEDDGGFVTMNHETPLAAVEAATPLAAVEAAMEEGHDDR